MLLVSCTTLYEEPDNWGASSELPSGHNIAIMANSGTATRTQIDPSDMQSVMWSENDKIALWAMEESASQFSFAAAPLSLHYYGTEYNTAVFTGNVPQQAEGSYTYYATYPTPTLSNGTSATLSLPSTQSGYYDGVADLMFARAEGLAALSDDALKNGSLTFNQLTHAIRIAIPKERDRLGATTKLQVTFPTEVVGDATINLADNNPAITLTKGSKTIYIDFDQVISDAGYVWLFIAPTTIDGDIEFVGYDKDDIPSKPITKHLSHHEMAAGHVTPITLTIPEEAYRSVVLTISDNKLGENMTSVTLTAPAGAYFAGDLSTITVPVNAEGNFEFSYSAARYDTAFRAGEIGVTFESNNAIVPRAPIRLTREDKFAVNYRDYTIPYLFEEDFSGVSGTGSYNELTGKALSGLEDYWPTGRIYAYWDGNCVALKAFYLLGVTYFARLKLDLDGMTYLKPNAKVTVSIEFNADWKKNKIDAMRLLLYDDDNSDNTASVSLISNDKVSSGYIPTKRNVSLPNCTAKTVIVWETDQGKGSGIKKGYDYTYIDNIKISIK